MSLAQNVSAASARHDVLLNELSSLDYVPSALEQANKYVADVGQLVREAAQKLDDAEREKKKEWKEHHEMQGSTVRRTLSKLVGRGEKWKQKATKEEREFLDALEREMKQKHSLEALQADLENGKQRVAELGSAQGRREVLQQELEDLYRRVFDGPTPDAPQDDQLEWQLREADNGNNHHQATLNHEAQVLAILGNAHGVLSSLVQKLAAAESHSTMDMWGVGGPAADMFETHAITQAQMLQHQDTTLMDQACRMHPAVGALPAINVPRHSMTDIYFDNVFSDMAQHERITTALQSARMALGALTSEVSRGKQRVDGAADRARASFAALSRARSALHDFRRETFQNIAHQGPTPSYDQPSSPAPAAGGPYSPPEGAFGARP
ncbi:hypothetical protein AURDEDRAFT_174158 [Auricularia subglabra TFB-10046 SS5]|nr:hypothetical protein AURDEDRAFT_174158 [Auricularia subglabra TFB-10046 SS5]